MTLGYATWLIWGPMCWLLQCWQERTESAISLARGAATHGSGPQSDEGMQAGAEQVINTICLKLLLSVIVNTVKYKIKKHPNKILVFSHSLINFMILMIKLEYSKVT